MNRLETQVKRYRQESEDSEKLEDELKTEKRKLQREVKINALVCIYSPADPNIGHYVELTLFNGKLGGFLVIRV